MPVLTSTETLFGGLLAVAALFGVARAFGLSNYWSGIIAGTLPFIAYLAYGTFVAQAGDMIAIHLAVFLATAAVLGVFASIRKEKTKMHWVPRFIALFFGGLVVFNAVLLSISSHGLPDRFSAWFLPNPENQRLHTAFPGVIPHDRNKLYEPHMQRIEEQRNLGWKLELTGLDTLRSGEAGSVAVSIKDAANKPVSADKVEIALWRMANSSNDQRISLERVADGEFKGTIQLPHPGRWLVEVTATRGEDQHTTQQSLFIDETNPKK